MVNIFLIFFLFSQSLHFFNDNLQKEQNCGISLFFFIAFTICLILFMSFSHFHHFIHSQPIIYFVFVSIFCIIASHFIGTPHAQQPFFLLLKYLNFSLFDVCPLAVTKFNSCVIVELCK